MAKSQQAIHIRRGRPVTATAMCGRSSDPRLKQSLQTVAPQQAAKATCMRCLRANASSSA